MNQIAQIANAGLLSKLELICKAANKLIQTAILNLAVWMRFSHRTAGSFKSAVSRAVDPKEC